MSKLLIEEPPLQVLPSLAVSIGLNEAIFVQQLHYWLLRSDKVHDGRTWIYNSAPEWKEQFPFWYIKTIRRVALSCESKGIVIAGCFNKKTTDRTKWYTIDYSSPLLSPISQTGNSNCPTCPHGTAQDVHLQTDKKGTSIPETTAETTTKDNTPSPSGSDDTSLKDSPPNGGPHGDGILPANAKPWERGYNPKQAHSFPGHADTDHVLAFKMSKWQLKKTEEARNRKLTAKPDAKPIIKLFRIQVTPERIVEVIRWLNGPNLNHEFSYDVQSSAALYSKWDKICNSIEKNEPPEQQHVMSPEEMEKANQ